MYVILCVCVCARVCSLSLFYVLASYTCITIRQYEYDALCEPKIRLSQ